MKRISLVWKERRVSADLPGHDGSTVVFRRFGGFVPAVDQSQRSRLRDSSPEVDICVLVPAAALRYI